MIFGAGSVMNRVSISFLLSKWVLHWLNSILQEHPNSKPAAVPQEGLVHKYADCKVCGAATMRFIHGQAQSVLNKDTVTVVQA